MTRSTHSRAVVAMSLGGLLFGFDTAVISGVTEALRDEYLSEIFPTDVRARGQLIGSATHWVANAVLSFTFPVLAERSHSLSFWFFAAAMVLQSLLIWRFFPETRGRVLETISADLSARSLHP